ncbi:ATP-dependent (S)-NAD(P)H-hydrate dehydratase isoform X3 [Physcomitrium patens]|uniref:ATP-dependent (S)-NAD(P)H-hydrate dehydratase isoform X3 n=1 Tax=Physcomitrium patens TaxID=3218 RepID=UPI000D17CBBB|nr:ATP-dependent (S)-NAD(P)H-hydrate dehydratase isoform X1 [Physcomitrium patens]|eukprot:XP_024381787.1 ATP-dependent (S)-NAD(P)H-hydrate dehydratase isoform X1 [Physcomitrella patens]
MEEPQLSRVEEIAEEVMSNERLAQRREVEELERAACRFDGTRLEVVADELLRSLPGQRQCPKLRRARQYAYSTDSSSTSSSSPYSSGSSTRSSHTPRTRDPEPRRSLQVGAAMGGNSTELQKILPALEKVVPVLAPGRHKGQAGKIAVIGGCREYTGAPYFAAISALKMGADLAHVFCTSGAATVIKSYSPELIVHPVLHESYDVGEIGEEEISGLKDKVLAEVGKWLQRFDCIVIGPGLGRDPILLDCVAAIIEEAKFKNIPLVLDGDGLFLVTNQPELIIGYPLAILTPNVMEHKRLVAKIVGERDQNVPQNPEVSNEDLPGQLQDLAKRMEGVTILQKGKTDYISDGKTVLSSDYYGSPRRCGGQGDVLSGSTAVFVSWAKEYFSNENAAGKKEVEERVSNNPTMVGALAGSLLCRKSAANAFAQHKRATTTTNIIEYLGHSMDELFPLPQ